MPLLDEEILRVSSISNVWQYERRICVVMFEIQGSANSSVNEQNNETARAKYNMLGVSAVL